MIRSKISDDMVNISLRQMGAISIKTSPAHINIAKFEIGEEFRITYMYEVKEEEIYLQRVNPYPMMIGKIYNEQQVIDIIDMDLKKFQAAYRSSNFPKFVQLANDMATFNKEVENLFMTHNVPSESLDKLDQELARLHEMIAEINGNAPLLSV